MLVKKWYARNTQTFSHLKKSTQKNKTNKTNQKHTPKENPCNFKVTYFIHKLYLFEKKIKSVKTIYANLSSRCLTNRLFQYRKVSPPAKM